MRSLFLRISCSVLAPLPVMIWNDTMPIWGDAVRSTQKGVQFKTYELFISGISHLIFLDHSWPQVTETLERESVNNGRLLYLCPQFPITPSFSSLKGAEGGHFEIIKIGFILASSLNFSSAPWPWDTGFQDSWSSGQTFLSRLRRLQVQWHCPGPSLLVPEALLCNSSQGEVSPLTLQTPTSVFSQLWELCKST